MSDVGMPVAGAAATLHQRRGRSSSRSNPFCHDGADCDVPAVEDVETTALLRAGGVVPKDDEGSLRAGKGPVGSVLSAHTIKSVAGLVLVAFLLGCAAVYYFMLPSGTSLLEEGDDIHVGKGGGEYREIKDPSKFHWSSKLASLDQVLLWFQALPDLPAHVVGMRGIGTSHMAITTDENLDQQARDRVQRAFNLGVRNLHAFSPFESLRHFCRCLQIDPRAVSCLWGLHMAMKWDAGYSVAAQEAEEGMIELARELRTALSKPERLLIEVATAVDETEACIVLLDKHQALFESGVSTAEFVEIDSFCSWQLVASSTNLYGHPLEPERTAAQRALKRLVAESPSHTGTHHYVIHAYEDTFTPELATRSARTLERLAPGAAHFQHMPGHIYYLIGDYAEAARAFQNSTVLDEAYFADTGVLPANNWNYIHNMAYAVANFIEAGRRGEALAAATVLMNLDIPKPDDPRNLQLLQPVQFSPDTSRAGGRFFYQALLAKPFVLLRNQEWALCSQSFEELLSKMKTDFNVGYLRHLPQYYRALQLFCQGMDEVYGFLDITSELMLNQHATSQNGSASVRAWTPLVVPSSKDALSERLVSLHDDAESAKRKGSDGAAAPNKESVPSGNVDKKKQVAIERTRKILNGLISLDTALLSSSELDDNDGLAPPEVHVKNRAFFALGVHVLELQAVLKAAEGNFRRAAELLTQADSREQHILYNEPVCYPRPVLQTMGDLELMLYFANGKSSSLYLDRAIRSLTAVIENPIHQRSGHALRQLVLALLTKHDHLGQQLVELRRKRKALESIGEETKDTDSLKTLEQRRERSLGQEENTLSTMAKLLKLAGEYTSEFQWSWRHADIKFNGFTDQLPGLQAAIENQITLLERGSL